MSLYNVRIAAGGGYDVMIGSGLLNKCGEIIRNTSDVRHIAIITDSTVKGLYLKTAYRSMEESGLRVSSFSFLEGEKSKNMQTLSGILEFLAGADLTRKDMIAALGGGVTGDLSGFAAGCYMRGIPFVQLPTTLLSAVDSSVGGKTAVDLKAGKNLAGLFLQPSAVICDTDCLKTLPRETLADGCAETIKTGVLSGETLFSLIESGNAAENMPGLIAQCVTFKGKIVEEDEFENGIRKTLNLGHTVGHAVEKCSDYEITHGHAVAIGLAVISRSAVRMGLCSTSCAGRIENALIKYGLPVMSPFSAPELARAALSDKKRTDNMITLVLPRHIGDCVMKNIHVNELEEIIAKGLEAL